MDHGYRADKVDETDETFRLRQREPAEFEEGSFRTITLREGVQAVIGRLKAREAEGVVPRAADQPSEISATVRPRTWDPEARTIELVLSDERTNEIPRYTWGGEIAYYERLSLQPEHVRLGRINNGAPVLMVHRAGDPRAQIGVFVQGSIRVEGEGDERALVGTARFSSHLDEEREAHVQEIADGIRRNVSVGWRPFEQIWIPGDGGPDRVLVIDWEPMEVSSVPMGADDGAMFRAVPIPPRRQGAEMPDTGMPGLTASEIEIRDIRVEELAEERARQIVAERDERRAQIERLRVLGTSDEQIRAWVEDSKVTVAEARELAFAAAEERECATAVHGSVSVEGGRDERDVEAMRILGHLLCVRLGKDEQKVKEAIRINDEAGVRFAATGFDVRDLEGFALKREARKYARYNLLRLAEDRLSADGYDLAGVGVGRLADMACGIGTGLHGRGLNTTSSFPLLLAETLNTSVRMGYLEQPVDLRWCTRMDAPDFRSLYVVTLGDLEDLEEIDEGGEYPTSTLTESREGWAVVDYGKIFGLTRKLIVNDRLGAWSKLGEGYVKVANRRIRNATFGLLTANAALSDTVTLFHTSRGNTDDTGAVPSIAAIDAMGLRMATRPGHTPSEGETPTAPHMLRWLLTARKWLTRAQQELGMVSARADIAVTSPASAIPKHFEGIQDVVFDPILDAYNGGKGAGNAWFGTDGETVHYSWLEGEEGVQVALEEGFEIRGLKIRLSVALGAGVPDWRGLDRNLGAAS
ncbi:MAG: hypothetical protein PVJ64_00230 [Gemmatimonadales bacterium]